MKRNFVTIMPVFLACLVLNTCFVNTAAAADITMNSAAEVIEADADADIDNVLLFIENEASFPRQRGNNATGDPTAKQRVHALIRGAPPSMVTLTDRFRIITAPPLSAGVNGNDNAVETAQTTLIIETAPVDILYDDAMIIEAADDTLIIDSNSVNANSADNGNIDSSGSDSNTIDKIELLTWREASSLIGGGTIIEVEDIWTGLRYTLRCASISGHADVEPLTAEDTEIIYKTRDGVWSWDARPVWVTIDGRTLAASINGNPHAGSTIADNEMNGHLCLHFTGTVTNSKSYQADLRSAIEIAWEASLVKVVPIDHRYIHTGAMRIA